jgi:hypothetical protein
MEWLILLPLVALLAFEPAYAGTHGQGFPNPVGVNWSTLGVVADGVTEHEQGTGAPSTGGHSAPCSSR